MFTDQVVVEMVAGKGGNGVVAWRREPFLPKGGPWGGNGGCGGSIYLEADPQVVSLDAFRHRRRIKAENGVQGGSAKRQGRRGADLILSVPCGTLIKDAESGELLHDLTEAKEKILLCSGGRGGRGNASFASSRRRAPHFSTDGSEGQVRKIELELKLIADVGFLGFPNAGKSTLLNSITQVPVRIAPYPFTTLRPNLGYIELEDYSRVLLADIPGVIEGAHDNRGLGLEFLRHIERTQMVVFVLDAAGYDGRDPISDYRILLQELGSYDPEMLNRPRFILLNKVDLEEAAEQVARFLAEFPEEKERIIEMSATGGVGVDLFVERVSRFFLERSE